MASNVWSGASLDPQPVASNGGCHSEVPQAIAQSDGIRGIGGFLKSRSLGVFEPASRGLDRATSCPGAKASLRQERVIGVTPNVF